MLETPTLRQKCTVLFRTSQEKTASKHRRPTPLDELTRFNEAVDESLHCDSSGLPIELQAQAEDEQVVVRVYNQGPAIPHEAQRHRFDPPTRVAVTQDKRNATGLGLGLYIAGQIAEAHGGTIELTASPDEQGTTFTVTLPSESTPEAETTGLV